jgi:hypothetical protein
MFCAPVFFLILVLYSLSNFIIPSKCLRNFICAASKRCLSLAYEYNINIYLSGKVQEVVCPINMTQVRDQWQVLERALMNVKIW